MRTVVVGASSGLGRCIATGLGARGDRIALLARRQDRLVRAAKEAGPDARPIVCDVTDPVSVDDAVSEAASALGGFDGLVYATGIGELAMLADHDVEMWRRAFDTNVIGAALVTRAAVPHLTESKGVAVYLSSISASISGPYPGLGSYAVSKAALDKMVDAWRGEHPAIGFTRISVGDSAGGEGESMTEFASGWSQEVAAKVMPEWIERRYVIGSLLDVDDLVHVVHAVLHTGPSACIQHLTILPRPPVS
jgi:NAD(P)-dependent dehydrogenase (short-subunit alcohol dehydrogenase family)